MYFSSRKFLSSSHVRRNDVVFLIFLSKGEECRKNKEDLEAKVYETLLSQVNHIFVLTSLRVSECFLKDNLNSIDGPNIFWSKYRYFICDAVVFLQVWSLLTGFCHKPTDVSTAFKNIAKILGSALTDQKNLRQLVIQALRNLINTAEEGKAENFNDCLHIHLFQDFLLV